jgi:hypothetical protein
MPFAGALEMRSAARPEAVTSPVEPSELWKCLCELRCSRPFVLQQHSLPYLTVLLVSMLLCIPEPILNRLTIALARLV